MWKPQGTTWLALVMAWDDGQTLTDRWRQAQETVALLHPRWPRGTSLSGFTNAWVRHSATVVPAVVRRFQRVLADRGGPHGRWKGWCLLAVDGTRLEAPHTRANELGLGCAGRAKTGPQVFLTTLWHLGWGLPYDFRVGPGTDSERRHLDTMLAGLPPQTLLVADAGFVSYALCHHLQAAGHAFVLRVGGNLTLLTDLGYHAEERDGLVTLWPQDHQHAEPLLLRLIAVQDGDQTVYLLTNVRATDRLTDAEVQKLYGLRWGVEVFFRSAKQTLERRRLLSRTPATCLAEAQATVLGLWLLGLLSVTRLVAQGIAPVNWSVAGTRTVVRQAVRRVLRDAGGGGQLAVDLATAVKDGYTRRGPKQARNYPRKKRYRPPGPPKIRAASARQQQRAARLRAANKPK